MALSACGPDPRAMAQADATRIQAQVAVADAQVARAQRVAEAAITLDEKKAASAQWVESWNFFVKTWWFCFTISASMSSGLALLALTIAFSWGAIGIGRATGQAAWVRANLIAMDQQTRQFPIYIQHIGNGKFTLTDMNTGMVQPLDIRNAADRQLIAAAGAVRLAGAVAHEARLAKNSDSTGVAIVGTRPVVIGARMDGLEVGEYLQEEHHAN